MSETLHEMVKYVSGNQRVRHYQSHLFDKHFNFQTDQLLRKTPIEVEKDATDNPLLKEDPICRVF